MYSNMFSKHTFIKKDVFMIKGRIIEFDMKSGGFNIIRSKNLLPDNTIKELMGLDKENLNIRIGLMCRDDRMLSKQIMAGFAEYREQFFKCNDIQDSEVVSIKKDAIFLLNKIPKKRTFDYVHFVDKNSYTSYFYIDKKEFYFNSVTKKLDIKGISDNKLKLHNKYMIKFLKDIFIRIENNVNRNEIMLIIRKFCKDYINLKLKAGYYREFNDSSKYIFNGKPNITRYVAGNPLNETVDDDEYYIKNLDISYNYKHIILPLIQFIFK